MEDLDSKNMIILKDLPSNIVKEAYVVFKSNKMIKKFQKVNKNNKKKQQEESNRYVVKEAEMLVLDYIEKVEKSEEEVITNSKINKKLKKYAYITSIIIFIQLILLIIK